MEIKYCSQCGVEFEADEEDASICDDCLEKIVLEVLEGLGQPMILDEEERVLYTPKGMEN